MKKLLFVALAAVGMTACVQNEELAVSKGNAIAFANDFIDNATKSIDGTYQNNGTDANELTKFHVYGTVQNANGLANIFNEELVSKQTSGAWTYDVNKTQYWVSGNTYNFAAVANAEAVVDVEQGLDGMPTAIKYDATQAANGTQHDLLYAEKKGIAYQSGDATTVKFTFAHLLAKAKFTVKNQMQNGNGNYYTVEDVKILDAVKTATYEVGRTWVAHAGQHDVTFGHVVAADANTVQDAIKLYENGVGASNYERLLVPQENAALKIQFGLKYYVQDKVSGDGVLNHSETKSVDATVTLEAGKAYNFIITLGNPGEPISFDVEKITDWVEKDVETTKVVSSAADLAAAIANPAVGEVVLANDITLNDKLTRAEGAGATIAKSFVLDGNGYTLSYAGNGAAARAIDIVAEAGVEKNVTIKNLTINCTSSYCQRGINFNNTNGTLVLENVKVYGQNVTYALNLPGSSDGANVTINNCELTGNIALNVWGENMVINVNNSTLTSVDNSTVEGYTAVKLNNDGATSAEGSVINLTNCKVVAHDENGEPSYATMNATATGAINWDEATTFVGGHKGQVAIVYYTVPADQFYSCTTLKRAIEKAVETKAAGVRLTSDTTVAEGFQLAANVNLDLNGHTLTYTGDDVLFRVNGGNLTINGSVAGSKIYTNPTTPGEGGNGYVALVKEGGVVTFNGGVYEAVVSCTIAQAIKGTVNVNGGKFSVYMDNAEWNDANGNARYLLNCTDAAWKDGSAKIVVNGGEFYKFNPENNAAEGANTNFVATGYKVVEANGWYTVVAE